MPQRWLRRRWKGTTNGGFPVISIGLHGTFWDFLRVFQGGFQFFFCFPWFSKVVSSGLEVVSNAFEMVSNGFKKELI